MMSGGNLSAGNRENNSVRNSYDTMSQTMINSHMKAIQVTLESAMFQNTDFRYFITVTIEDGVKGGDQVRNQDDNRILGFEKEKY